MKCIICEQELGDRPPYLLLQHKCEGIGVVAVCQKDECWRLLGKKMSLGKH